ncbi:MAG: transcription termination/antitermination NusG family protein [Gemmataceae bacterium]
MTDPDKFPADATATAVPPHDEEAHVPTQDHAEPPADDADEPAMDDAAEPTTAEQPPAVEEPAPENRKHWYVVKVQSGREDTIKEAIERRVRKEGLEEFFGQIVIPVEKYTEVKTDKNGKRVTRTKERKLYPGYLMVEVEYNDRILYLFRETSGVGDFVGAHPHDLTKPPTPMSDREIQKMLGPTHGKDQQSNVPPPPKGLDVNDRVRVIDGTFNGMDGSVKQILEAVGKVQVELTIFGRPVAVDLEYYQVEQL